MNTLLDVASNVTVINSVGFGTAALGQQCHNVVLMALEAGFRYFDTAEENQHWYNSAAVGTALREYHARQFVATASNSDKDYINDDECVMVDNSAAVYNTEKSDGEADESVPICMNLQSLSSQQRFCYEIRISTKIPPWELISSDHIRNNAKRSRMELVSFCDDTTSSKSLTAESRNYKIPLDVYYIHAPQCWKGWHTNCDNPPKTLDLRSAWLAMEAIVGIDHSARRIGLSNVRTDELLDIIQFVQERQTSHTADTDHESREEIAPPRLPDVIQAFADPIEPASEMRQLCAQYNIEFVSYSTLGTQHIYKSNNQLRNNPVLTHPIVMAMAERYDRSTAEIVLSWAIQHHMSVIPRSSQQRHIEQLARLLPTKDNNNEDGSSSNNGSQPRGFLSTDDLAQMDLLKNSI